MKIKLIKKEINKGKNKINSILKISLFCLIFISFLMLANISLLADQPNKNLTFNQFEQYIEESSYSDFQKRMVLNTVQEAIDDGISKEDTLSLLKNSIKNDVDPYNVKKFLDTLILTKNEGISEKPIFNKIKEGLAKNVDQRLIVNAINQKSGNMLLAKNMLVENEIKNGEFEEMIDVIADSLTNGVPVSILSQILKICSEHDKSWAQVEDVAQELANLGLKAMELGIDNDKVETIFNKALENNSNFEEVYLNIQDLMVAAIAVKVTSESSSMPRGDNNSGAYTNGNSNGDTSSPVSSNNELTGSIPTTPSGESGSSPISSGDSNKTDGESGSSPLN